MLKNKEALIFFYDNGIFFTYFYTAFTTHALFCIDGNRFSILHLEYFYRANIHALFTTNTFCFINNWIKSHLTAS